MHLGIPPAKKFGRAILLKFLLGVSFIYLYCEFLIYFVVQMQCDWPTLKHESPVYVMVLADIHLLGTRDINWFIKTRREWQTQRAFQTALMLHQPDIVFILGDIFDEGKWSTESEFEDYISRFNRIFEVPQGTEIHVVVGNHDIGFHYRMTPYLTERFMKRMSSPPVKLVTIKGNHFVLINSMAMEGDGCTLCTKAVKGIEQIEDILKCTKGSSRCNGTQKLDQYSLPIIMQHFPLYRESDAVCTEVDAAPLPERNNLFEERFDCLSKESTEYLVEKLRPRAVFGAHTHHSCRVRHSFAPTNEHKTEFVEYTVPSFSWGNRPDPKYYLVSASPHEVEVSKCGVPRESSMQLTAVFMGLALFAYIRHVASRRGHVVIVRRKWSGKKV